LRDLEDQFGHAFIFALSELAATEFGGHLPSNRPVTRIVGSYGT
jgi:hypothetical protein